jgi:hypothetical protein
MKGCAAASSGVRPVVGGGGELFEDLTDLDQCERSVLTKDSGVNLQGIQSSVSLGLFGELLHDYVLEETV